MSQMLFNQALDYHKQNQALKNRIKRLEEGIEAAWGIIANVDNGIWQEQSRDWREATMRWLDEHYLPELSELKAKEVK